jgi:hypothetical protein
MPNHYHMLVQTPEANLSRSMRHLNGVYTQRYNRRHKCDGQLFRGRYKSILIDTDKYLLQAVRYIHRNPLKAGLVENISDYTWSSHKGYVSVAKKWDWLHKNHVLTLLSKNRKDWIRYYRKWVAVDTEDEVGHAIGRVKWPACLGSQEFIDRIREKYGAGKLNREIPSSRELMPDPGIIMDLVCKHYNVPHPMLFESRRGTVNHARNAAIYLTRKLRKDTLKEIGIRFHIQNERTVRSVVERVRKQLAKDRNLGHEMEKITEMIQKGQKST